MLVFRRPLCTDPRSGKVDERALKEYRHDVVNRRAAFLQRRAQREQSLVRLKIENTRISPPSCVGEMSLPTSPALHLR